MIDIYMSLLIKNGKEKNGRIVAVRNRIGPRLD